MIGCGRAAVSEICEISRANLADGAGSEAIAGLGPLGGFGKHQSNQERDLHRWVQGVHSMTLVPYEVTMVLNVSWSSLKAVFQQASNQDFKSSERCF